VNTSAQDRAERLEAGSVSTPQYLAEMSGGIFQRYEDIPAAIRPRLERRRDGGRAPDFAGMLKHGKEWVIAPLKELQPRSYAAFQEVVGPLLLGIVLIKDLMNPDGPPLVAPAMFFDASGRMLQVRPTFAGCTYEEGVDTLRGTLKSLPTALAESWLWRTEGWRIPGEAFQGPLINRCMVRHPMQGWEPVDDVLKSYDQKRYKSMMDALLHRFPEAVITLRNPHDGDPQVWTSMRCFLDTRPSGVVGPVGDQLFVFDHRQDQVVYHVHRGDIANVRILREPVGAIDRYCEHMLRRAPCEFDFLPWGEPCG
jgi:hypothetical protein